MRPIPTGLRCPVCLEVRANPRAVLRDRHGEFNAVTLGNAESMCLSCRGSLPTRQIRIRPETHQRLDAFFSATGMGPAEIDEFIEKVLLDGVPEVKPDADDEGLASFEDLL